MKKIFFIVLAAGLILGWGNPGLALAQVDKVNDKAASQTAEAGYNDSTATPVAGENAIDQQTATSEYDKATKAKAAGTAIPDYNTTFYAIFALLVLAVLMAVSWFQAKGKSPIK